MSTLYSSQILKSGQELVSENGAYHAIMQHDGNFVIYFSGNFESENAIWSSGTWNHHYVRPFYLRINYDGNLVIYDARNKPCWAIKHIGNKDFWISNKSSEEFVFYKLVLENDGNLVIYDINNKIIWKTLMKNEI